MATAGETIASYTLITDLERPALSTEAFDARDTRTGNEVVLEILREGASSVDKARFGMRARRLLAIQHPALITTLEAAASYCAFEGRAGESLAEHAGIAIARARQKLAWLSQIASALAELHKGGVVHAKLTLDVLMVLPDGSVKLGVSVDADVSASPVDDMRAFGAATCELVLGSDATDDEAGVARRLVDAGLPLEPASLIARVRAGAPMTSADLADRLAPYADYAGPSTEPLLPIMPRTS